MRTRQSASVTVKIAELKNRLSHYLRRVQRGESILVCDRDRVIARIERAGTHSPVPGDDAEWLDRLERRGVVRRGSGTLSRTSRRSAETTSTGVSVHTTIALSPLTHDATREERS